MTAVAPLAPQTKSVERAVVVLGLSDIDIEGTESLDVPSPFSGEVIAGNARFL